MCRGSRDLALGTRPLRLCSTPLLSRHAPRVRPLPRCASTAAMGPVKHRHGTAEMSGRTGFLAVALAGVLLCSAAPSRAADEPIATAPIPPVPMMVPTTAPQPPRPAKPVVKTSAKPARPTASRERERSAERRKPVVHDAAQASRRAEQSKSRNPVRERRAEQRQAVALKSIQFILELLPAATGERQAGADDAE